VVLKHLQQCAAVSFAVEEAQRGDADTPSGARYGRSSIKARFSEGSRTLALGELADLGLTPCG
jgi:hypothetical protein